MKKYYIAVQDEIKPDKYRTGVLFVSQSDNLVYALRYSLLANICRTYDEARQVAMGWREALEQQGKYYSMIDELEEQDNVG